MLYTIKDVSSKTGLSISTLRYYDKAGLLPFVARNAAGYREFTEGDLHLLKTICCLKNTGMKLADIRQYVDDVMVGPSTVAARRSLLTAHRRRVEEEQQRLRANLQEIDYKLALYNDPHATVLVQAERDFAAAEKDANGLPNPYRPAR